MNKLVFIPLIPFLIMSLSCSSGEKDIEMSTSNDTIPNNSSVNQGYLKDSTEFIKFYGAIVPEVAMTKDFLFVYVLEDSVRALFFEGDNNYVTNKIWVEDNVIIEVRSRSEIEGRITLLSFDINGRLYDVLSVMSYSQRISGADNIVRSTQLKVEDYDISLDILEMVHNSDSKPIFTEDKVARRRFMLDDKTGKFRKQME